jgi:uncharacterized protein
MELLPKQFKQPPFVDERAGNDGKGFYIRTFTGQKLYWSKLADHDYNIIDIAHALSMKCRWSGHTRSFYSVAQHSVMVMQLVEPKHKLAALLHDAAEAYMPDFPSPLKWFLRDRGFTYLSALEHQVDRAIARKFETEYPRDPSIKAADLVILSTESRDLMPDGEERLGMVEPLPEKIQCWSPLYAKETFLVEYRKLMGPITE